MIRSGEHVNRVSELELELKAGDSRQLYELALRLQHDVPLALESRSKAARGYALHGSGKPRPAKAEAAVLDAKMSVGVAFKEVMWAGLVNLHANEGGMLTEGNPEFVHQMRVALRRLRSALGVFSPPVPAAQTAPLAKELKWLASCLGPARDWDVFATETLPPIETEFGAHGELRAFSVRCGELRRRANARARRAVRSRRYQRLVLRLAGWIAAEEWRGAGREAAGGALQEPVAEFAAAVLDRRYRQARARGRRLAERSPAELSPPRLAGTIHRHLFRSAGGSSSLRIFDAPVASAQEAQSYAEALLADLRQRLITASGSCLGNPAVVVGTLLDVSGVGRFEGTYVVEQASHTVGSSGYETSFQVRSQA